MWSKNGMPVDAEAAPGAVDLERELDGRLLRLRCAGARRCDELRPSGFTSQDPDARSAARNASFSAGGTDRDTQAVVESGPAREVAHEHPRSTSRSQSAWPSPAHPEQQEVGARREHGDAVDGRELRGDALPLGDQARDPVVHLGPEVEREAARRSAWPTPGGTAARPSRAPRPPTAARPRSRAATPPSTTPSSTCAPRPADGRRAPARARSTARTRRRPRRRRRARRWRRAAPRWWPPARPCRSGCWGCTRTRSWARAPRRARRGVGIDREVGAPLPHHDLGAGDAGDVGVQRVRGLEHRGAPPGAAVGEQQRLEHLVGAVGAEQPGGRLPEVGAERVAQRAGAAVGVAVQRAPRSSSSQRSTNSGGGANGLSLVLSRTATSSCGEW